MFFRPKHNLSLHQEYSILGFLSSVVCVFFLLDREIYKKCAEAPQENYNFSRTASYIWILRDLRLGKCKIRNKRERESSNNVIVITTGLINSDSYCLKYMRGEGGGRREVEQNAITSNYSKTIVSHFPGN